MSELRRNTLAFELLLISLALAGCQTAAQQATDDAVMSMSATPPNPNYKPPSDKVAIDTARRTVTSQLKDPDSAKFSQLVRKLAPNARGEPTDVICGSVNAKNSFGGYTGSRPFVFFVERAEVTMAEGDPVNTIVVNNFCGTGFRS